MTDVIRLNHLQPAVRLAKGDEAENESEAEHAQDAQEQSSLRFRRDDVRLLRQHIRRIHAAAHRRRWWWNERLVRRC